MFAPETKRNTIVSKVYMDVKDKIIIKSDSLFRKFGIRGVTIDDICSELGISKKTIYTYFDDKHSIALESIKYYWSGLLNEIGKIKKTSKNSIHFFIELSNFFRQTITHINPLFVHDLKKFHPDLFKITHDLKKKVFIKTLSNNIKRGKKEGFIRKTVDEIIITKLRLEEIELAFDQNLFPYKKFEIINVQLQFFDHFMRGILTNEGLKIYEKSFLKYIK
jgi:AcrR family transcriptional regulator